MPQEVGKVADAPGALQELHVCFSAANRTEPDRTDRSRILAGICGLGVCSRTCSPALSRDAGARVSHHHDSRTPCC